MTDPLEVIESAADMIERTKQLLELTEERLRVSQRQLEQSRRLMERIVEFGHGPNSLVVGLVRRMHVRQGLLLDGAKIDHGRYQPVGRIAGRRYCTFGRIIEF